MSIKSRRRHHRVDQRFECRWLQGGVAQTVVANISLNGCFVQSIAAPLVGDAATIVLQFGESSSLQLSGKVVAVDAGLGFAMEFDALDKATEEQLADLLAASGAP